MDVSENFPNSSPEAMTQIKSIYEINQKIIFTIFVFVF